ncbi:MAG TPA: AsmA-like C-terminal region-containing protein [Candidatus Polarisedimenticolaceae bacterium]|nr:AsmA-like C-terminal region-containing protein [Candidatus Polarisedimenticolaceae bacterium]
MSRRRKILLGAVTVPCVLFALLVFVVFADLGFLRGTVERVVGAAIGCELEIGGRFDLRLLGTPTVVAEDVVLVDPARVAAHPLVRIERLVAQLDPVSLLSSPIHVTEVELRGVRIDLDADAGLRPRRGTGRPADERREVDRPPVLQVEVDHATLFDGSLTLDGSSERPWMLEVERLDATAAAGRPASVRVTGRLDGSPIELSAETDPLDRLIVGRDVAYRLTVDLAGTTVRSHGRIGDLAGLVDPTLDVELAGASFDELARLLRLDTSLAGPFDLRAQVRPAGDRVEVRLVATTEPLTASLSGHSVSLLDFAAYEVGGEVRGTNLAAVGALFGRHGLPAATFALAGSVRHDDGTTTLDGVTARIDENTLSVDGSLGPAPARVGTDLEFDGRGPDLSSFSKLTGFDLPRGPYALHGRVVRVDEGYRLERVDLRTAAGAAVVDGVAGNYPEFAGTRLVVGIDVADLSVFSRPARVALPAEPLVARGTVDYDDDRLWVSGLRFELGATRGTIDGAIDGPPTFDGSEVDATIEGPELCGVGRWFGITGLPCRAFRAVGSVRFDDGLDLRSVAIRLEPATGEGGVAELRLDGRVETRPHLLGTDLRLEADGVRLADLTSVVPLPSRPFEVSGRLVLEQAGAARLDGVSGRLGEHRFAVDGVIGLARGLGGTRAKVELAGVDLADAARLLADSGVDRIPPLPATDYSITGTVERVEDAYRLIGIRGTIGPSLLTLDGSIGRGPDPTVDLTLDFRGPQASLLDVALDARLGPEPFHLSGRIERRESATRFDALSLLLGDSRSRLDGVLGPPPTFVGSDLDFRLAGGSLAVVGSIASLDRLPPVPFEIEGHVEGTTEVFSLAGLRVVVGQTDLAGGLSGDLRGAKPRFDGEFVSNRVDLGPWLPVTEPPAAEVAGAAATSTENKPGKPRLVSDAPLELDRLRKLNGRLVWTARELVGYREGLGDLRLVMSLDDGRLRIDPLALRGQHGGRFDIRFGIEPFGAGHRAELEANLEQIRLFSVLAEVTAVEQSPPVSLDVRLRGAGRSLHEMLASADGHAVAIVEPGRIESWRYEFLTTDVLAALLDALNPFRKERRSTEIECAVVVGRLEHGVLRLDPIAARTDRTTVVGEGRVRFDDERIDLDWAAKPRQGIGLSATAITNSYIKVSGRLSDPSIDVKPLRAVANTGAAVATMGLSILARGLWDRVTAERKVCERALEDAARIAPGSHDGG